MDTLLDHLCRFTVRAAYAYRLAAFLGSPSTPLSPLGRGLGVLSGFLSPAVFPTGVTSTLQRAVSSARGGSTPPSPLRSICRCRNLHRLSIEIALRLILRSRLTLIRLAWIRNPWSFGGRVSRPPSRYLCLHLLFHALQHPSRDTFPVRGMLPYHSLKSPGLRWYA